mmetsp:Transcript_16503/g.25654  ORF Transcript_16503/g.25654 Transcript_16503/m.25654 type:complete len:367 (-) Transcript_16503:455-1555(-)
MADYDLDPPPIISVNDLPGLFPDITPIEQNDGPNPVCAIAYTAQFIVAYNYLRAILAKDERSERALQLTALCVKLNPANYTVWHFRRQCLEELYKNKGGNIHHDGEDDDSHLKMLELDLQLAASLGGDNPKNYQIWYHRRALLQMILFGSNAGVNDKSLDRVRQELAYISFVLGNDGKNYHAWSHRQWIIKTSNRDELWNEEFDFGEKLIQIDPRNNSVWNHRWFISHRGQHQSSLSLNDARTEAQYALDGAALDPYNESPWRYLIGILKEQRKSNDSASVQLLVDDFETKTMDLRSVLENAGRDPDACSNMISARIDMLELKGDSDSLKLASLLANGLGINHDTIRKKYWLLREKELASRATTAC